MNVERIGISTGTFMDLSNPLKEGWKIIATGLKGGIYAPEIKLTGKVAQELGVGIELIYRVGIETYSPKLKNISPRVLQIHGPIHVSVTDAVFQGLGEPRGSLIKYAALGPLVARFMLGTIKGDMPKVENLASDLGVKRVVLHPWGAQHLINQPPNNILIGIEPDFRRLKESKYFVWQLKDVIRIAEELGAGIVFDVSHIVISTNSLGELFEIYEQFKKAPNGIVGIHFSVAIPGENREEFFVKGRGAMPLYSNTPDHVKGLMIEFYQYVMNDPDFNGPLILEMWSFPEGGGLEQRVKAIEETLNVLEGSKVPPRSISLPRKSPTSRRSSRL